MVSTDAFTIFNLILTQVLPIKYEIVGLCKIVGEVVNTIDRTQTASQEQLSLVGL